MPGRTSSPGCSSYDPAFKVTAILKKLYDAFGPRDYYVVIRNARSAPCTNEGQTGCLSLVVQYHPSTLPPSEIHGTSETLASDIAVLVVRGAVHAHDRAWATATGADPDAAPPYMPALDTPETMAVLRSAASGLRVRRCR